MIGGLFLVMRSNGAAFETVGPRSTAFDNLEAADKYARKMLDQHVGQRFMICKAIAAYEVEQVTSVKMLDDDAQKTDANDESSVKIVNMPSRQAI